MKRCAKLVLKWLWTHSEWVSYGDYRTCITAVQLMSHFAPPFQNLSNDHHHTCIVPPSATLTRASYHRLKGWPVSGILLRAAPSTMKRVERRRDARKPGIHNTLHQHRRVRKSRDSSEHRRDFSIFATTKDYFCSSWISYLTIKSKNKIQFPGAIRDYKINK